MHILFIPSWYPTEEKPIAGIFFREQALALSRIGLKIGVLAPYLRSLKHFPNILSSRKNGIRINQDEGVNTYRFNDWNWSYKFSRMRQKHWLKLGEILFEHYVSNEGIPDLIHAHCALPGGILASRIKKKYQIPFIITEHSTEFARGLIKGKNKHKCNEVFSEASERIAVSPSLSRLLSKDFSSQSKSWKWIPNLLEQRFETQALSENRFKGLEDKILKTSKFRFLNIAIITKKKGHIDLIEAFEKAFKGITFVELIIGGDGPLRIELEQLVRNKELQHQIKFLGALNRNEVQREMLNADVFILSSHYETFGVVLIEALACGKPIISTRCGGPECIVEKTNGLLVETNNIQQLSHAMVYMEKNILNYDSMSIRNNCIEKFGQVTVIKQIQGVYSAIHN